VRRVCRLGVKIFPMLSSTRYDLRARGDPKRKYETRGPTPQHGYYSITKLRRNVNVRMPARPFSRRGERGEYCALSSKSLIRIQVVGIVCESRKNTSPYPFGSNNGVKARGGPPVRDCASTQVREIGGFIRLSGGFKARPQRLLRSSVKASPTIPPRKRTAYSR
jgi:hypothetical protein